MFSWKLQEMRFGETGKNKTYMCNRLLYKKTAVLVSFLIQHSPMDKGQRKEHGKANAKAKARPKLKERKERLQKKPSFCSQFTL